MKVEECDDGGRSFESVGEEENILKEKIGDQSTNEASNLNQIEDLFILFINKSIQIKYTLYYINICIINLQHHTLLWSTWFSRNSTE